MQYKSQIQMRFPCHQRGGIRKSELRSAGPATVPRLCPVSNELIEVTTIEVTHMAAFPTSTTVLDSLLFRDAFGTPRKREVFSDFISVARYCAGELDVDPAQATCCVVPG